MFPRPKADIAGKIRLGGLRVVVHHMQEGQRCLERQAGPGRVVADPLGKLRAVDGGHHLFCHLSVLKLACIVSLLTFYTIAATPSQGGRRKSSVSAHELLDGFRVVVDGIAIDDGSAGLVQADQLHLGPFAAELDHCAIQCLHGGDIPEVRPGQINDDLLDTLLEIEGRSEAFGGSEEHLADHLVDPAVLALAILDAT